MDCELELARTGLEWIGFIMAIPSNKLLPRNVKKWSRFIKVLQIECPDSDVVSKATLKNEIFVPALSL